jgi:hypothetical protein
MVNKQGNNKKPYMRIKIVVGLTIFMVIAGFSTLAYTQTSSRLDDENGRLSYLDPFSLAIISIENSGALEASVPGPQYLVVTRPPIRIPFKPSVRSGFQPWPDSGNIYLP